MVYLDVPSILVSFFSDKEMIAERKGVVISKSDWHKDNILYENLRRYSLS
jgi:hypothetical protein